MNRKRTQDHPPLPHRGHRLAWFGWGAGALFLVLGVRMTLDSDPSSIDRAVNDAMASVQQPTVRAVAALFCWPGEGTYQPAIFCVVMTGVLFVLGARRWAVLFAVASGLAGIVSVAVKWLVDRPRPDTAGMHRTSLAYAASFPSGHVAFYGAMFLVVALMAYYGMKSRAGRNLIGIVCVLGVVVTGLSRLYLRVHWFSDVLGGACLAVWATGITVCLMLRAWPGVHPGDTD